MSDFVKQTAIGIVIAMLYGFAAFGTASFYSNHVFTNPSTTKMDEVAMTGIFWPASLPIGLGIVSAQKVFGKINIAND